VAQPLLLPTPTTASAPQQKFDHMWVYNVFSTPLLQKMKENVAKAIYETNVGVMEGGVDSFWVSRMKTFKEFCKTVPSTGATASAA